MASAFQKGAFQINAFQITTAVIVITPPAITRVSVTLSSWSGIAAAWDNEGRVTVTDDDGTVQVGYR